MVRRVHRVAERLRAHDAASSAALRTVAALGLAASMLFVALTVISLFGDDEPGTEVLGSQEEQPSESGPSAEVPSSTGEPRGTAESAGDLEVASTEGGAFFVYAEDPRDHVEGSATVIVRDDGEVRLTVGGSPRNGRATISATVENATGDVIVFEDGLSVAVHLDHEGVPWRTVEPADRSITELRPGERATVTTEIALDGFGHYDLTGDVFYARR